MTLYICNSVKGVIPSQAKQQIARDITDIHCQYTDSPRTTVHVFFFDDAPRTPINGKSVLICGNVISGLSQEQKTSINNRIKDAIQEQAYVTKAEIMTYTYDIPGDWVMGETRDRQRTCF